MTDIDTPYAPEMVQIFKCAGCERLAFIDELEQATKEQYDTNRRMVCGNCGTIVGADRIHDYALLGGVHTDG